MCVFFGCLITKEVSDLLSHHCRLLPVRNHTNPYIAIRCQTLDGLIRDTVGAT